MNSRCLLSQLRPSSTGFQHFVQTRKVLFPGCLWQALVSSPRIHSKNYTERSSHLPLSYTIYQAPDVEYVKPPVIVMHGMLGSQRNWTSLGNTLSLKTERKVIAVDLRNHGDSPHDAEMDYHVMTDDVEQLARGTLNLEKVAVIGHSMGGKVAMMLALTSPNLLEKLIVVDVAPSIGRYVGSTDFPKYLETLRSVTFNQKESSYSNVRKHIDEQLKFMFPEKSFRDFLLMGVVERDKKYQWKFNVDAIADNLDKLVAFPDIGKTFEGETIFIGGENSNHIGADDKPVIHSLFPGAVITQVAGAGHLVHYDKPEEFTKIVTDFLGKSHHLL